MREQLPQELDAVHARHLDIEHHDVGHERENRVARLERVACRLDLAACGKERMELPLEHRAEEQRIIDEQDADRLHEITSLQQIYFFR